MGEQATVETADLHEGEQLIELRKNAWAIVRDAEDVPERRRRPLIDLASSGQSVRDELEAISKIVDGREMSEINAEEVPTPSQNALDIMSAMCDLLILAMVREWSYGDVTIDVLLDVPSKDYDTLRDLTAPMFSLVVPDFGPSAAVKVKEDGTTTLNPDSPMRPSTV